MFLVFGCPRPDLMVYFESCLLYTSPPLSGAQDGNPRCWDRDVGQVGHRLAGLFPGATLPETVMFVVHKLPPNRDVQMSGQRQGKGKLSDAVLAGRCDSLL